ncbi:MAG: 2-C-methyl-D-erythritol 2,4-cyclodiphosphate synthase [Ignavibacteriales bacterium]|nr:2-C-methyl-D-erythritol 2,4-cyclodiphosphate synthase [Ignavibacteriales bacterium]
MKQAFPRVGIGYDVHKFALKRKLVVGGVTIPYKQGLLGHSDADVLLHALCDALLGAGALGDIGKHFPDTQMKYKNISSVKFLASVGKLLKEHSFRIINVDSTLILQEPKIAKYIPAMQKNIAKVLNIKPNQVSIKATTNEGIGFIGRGEGCAALAIATIVQSVK